jgi:hypothetical protein
MSAKTASKKNLTERATAASKLREWVNELRKVETDAYSLTFLDRAAEDLGDYAKHLGERIAGKD